MFFSSSQEIRYMGPLTIPQSHPCLGLAGSSLNCQRETYMGPDVSSRATPAGPKWCPSE